MLRKNLFILIATPLFLVFLSGEASARRHSSPMQAPAPVAAAPVPAAATPQAEGDYTPSGGTSVHWAVEASHTLDWGGTPYIPAGGIFQPRSLAGAAAATAANWALDQADLDTLKKHGVTQLLIEAGGASSVSTPITSIPAAALQRVLTYLDANGFTYGIDLNAFPPSTLEGCIVNPAIYRKPAPPLGGTTVMKSIEGLVSGLYFIASARDGSILAHGPIKPQDGTDALIPVTDQGGDDTVLLLYPTRLFDDSSIEGRHCPDFWSSADDVRDSLLIYFSHIKFGAGLRYFVDPLRDDCGYYGMANSGMIPSSPAYLMQFETWLNNKYTERLSVLEREWGVKNEDLPDIATAARCIPLWYQSKGLQEMYDPQSDKIYDILTSESHMWDDIHQFQTDSLQTTMNGLADAIKKGVADVPVLYRWSQASPVTVNHGTSGFDGLLIDSPLHGMTMADQAAGFAVSDAEHSKRTEWLVASLTPIAPTNSAASATHPVVGYGSQQALGIDQHVLTDIGVRGLLVDSLHSNSPTGISLLNAPPEQLDWIHAASAELSVEAASLAAARPTYLYYPSGLALAGAETQQFEDGVWWLPADFASDRLDLGPKLEGYSRPTDRSGKSYVFYSVMPGPPVVVQFPYTASSKNPDTGKALPNPKPVFTDAAGFPAKIVEKKDSITVNVTSEPLIMTGVSEVPIPVSAMPDEIAELERLLALGKAAHAPTQVYEQRLYYLQNNPELLSVSGGATTAQYEQMRLMADELKQFVSPFLWIEAETPTAQTFGSVIASSDTSGGAYLWLDTTKAPPPGGYQVQYPFRANSPGSYDIWASIAPAGGEVDNPVSAAPFTVTIDGGVALTANPIPTGDPYGSLARSGSLITGQFLWCRLTNVELAAGDHTLTITVNRPADSGRYTLGIDAICLSRGVFKPNGARKPDF